MFCAGDTVKVRWKDEGGETWTTATFLRHEGSRYVVRAYGEVRCLPYVDVCKYEPIDPDEVTANGVRHAGDILRMLQGYQEKLLLPEHRAKLRLDEDQTGIVSLGNTSLSIEPVAVEVKSIAGVVEVPGWAVCRTHVISHYPHDEDEVHMEALETDQTPRGVARKALRWLFDEVAEYFVFTPENEASLYEDYQADAKLAAEMPSSEPADEIPF